MYRSLPPPYIMKYTHVSPNQRTFPTTNKTLLEESDWISQTQTDFCDEAVSKFRLGDGCILATYTLRRSPTFDG